MYCWRILFLKWDVGEKCVVFAKNQSWLSRKVFLLVAGRGFVVLCGRGFKTHLPSLLCMPFKYEMLAELMRETYSIV